MSNRNPWLIQLSPIKRTSALFELDVEVVVIGRCSQCSLMLHEESVGDVHATVVRSDEGYTLLDSDSSSGTYVNHSRIIEHRLSDGDTIRIGSALFKFMEPGSSEIAYHQHLQNRAIRDGLTKAYNKSFLLEFLNREYERCVLHHRPLSFLMMDIDFFKQINDQHGHLPGDQVLQELARRIEPLLDADDIFARYGGEEFAVVMCENTIAEAEVLAEMIRQVVRSTPCNTSKGDVDVTLSIGIAGVTGEEVDVPHVNEIIQAADEMLYESKANGRDRITVRHPSSLAENEGSLCL